MMLITLIKNLANFFAETGYQRRLESYISSRYPQSSADVEMCVREFEHRQYGGWL